MHTVDVRNNSYERRTHLWVFAVGVLAVSLGTLPAAIGQSIEGTAHDFSSSVLERGLCDACHVPRALSGGQLIWNRELSSSSFTWGGVSETSGGTRLPSNVNAWSGSTKYCLSCHDGSVAAGDVMMGSGDGARTTVTGSAVIAPGGSLLGNHPVMIPYPYGNVRNTYNGIRTGDAVKLTSYKAAPRKVKIYTDPAGGPHNRGIECGSCHDPHGTEYSSFLRDTMSGSALCRDCHNR